MTLRSNLMSGAMIALLSASSGMAFAASGSGSDTDTTGATPAQPGYATQDGMLRSAEGALEALMDIHAAQVALKSEDTAKARTSLASAITAFDASEKAWNDLTIKDTEDPANPERFLPFDVSMSLGERFVPTPEAGKALRTANSQIQTGAQDQALATLRLADVDVTVSAAMLPIVATADSLESAQSALDQGDSAAAAKALAGIERSIIVGGFAIDGIPAQQTVAADQVAPTDTDTSPGAASANAMSGGAPRGQGAVQTSGQDSGQVSGQSRSRTPAQDAAQQTAHSAAHRGVVPGAEDGADLGGDAS